MTYRSRTSLMPSVPMNDGESFYWSAFDSFTNGMEHARPMSRQSTSINSRNYIDPWDLENYAYIQRNMESPEPMSRIPSPIDDTAFYYMSKKDPAECPCYAGLDEQLFYNAKYEMIPDDLAYSTYTDVESSSTERNSSCSGNSTVSTLQLHTPGFRVHTRSIVMPKPMPHIEFPAPPPPSSLPLPPIQSASAYEYYANVSIPNYQSVSSLSPANNNNNISHQHHRRNSRCYECIDEYAPLYAATSSIADKRSQRRSTYSLYGGGYAKIEPPNHLEKFGLSKKGLLQIDYSCNWNNLQRLIANK